MPAKVLGRILLGSLPITFILFSVGCKESELSPLIEEGKPVAHLGAASYVSNNSAVNSLGTATLHLTLDEAEETSLVAASGDSTTPPHGLEIHTHGTAACSNISVSSVSLHGATITVGGCSGDGSIEVQVEEGIASGEHHEAAMTEPQENDASSTQVVLVDNTLPTATLSVTNPVVGSAGGNNTVVATFSELIKDLSPTNVGGAFTIAGCTGTFSVSIAMSVNVSGHSVATATLSGATCADADVASVTVHLNQAIDFAANVGTVNPSAQTYDIDLDAPVVNLTTVNYPVSTTALSGSTAATIDISYTNAATQNLMANTGDSVTAPAGLTVGHTGNAYCVVALSAFSGVIASGHSTLTVNGCTGDGTVSVNANANIALSAGGLSNIASVVRSITVQTTVPSVTALVATSPTAGTNAANTVNLTMNQLIPAFSTTNLGGAIVVSGCVGTPPNVAISNGTDGSGHSTAVITLTGGTCAPGNMISVNIDPTKVVNLAGTAVSVTPAPATYTIL